MLAKYMMLRKSEANKAQTLRWVLIKTKILEFKTTAKAEKQIYLDMIQTIRFFFEWRVSYDIYLLILKHNKLNWSDQYEDWPLTLGEVSW